jgi:hypothetical protein
MHNIYDIKSICNSKSSYISHVILNKISKNRKFEVINEHKTDKCHVQSFGK